MWIILTVKQSTKTIKIEHKNSKNMNRIVLYALPLATYATVLDVITPLQKKKKVVVTTAWMINNFWCLKG